MISEETDTETSDETEVRKIAVADSRRYAAKPVGAVDTEVPVSEEITDTHCVETESDVELEEAAPSATEQSETTVPDQERGMGQSTVATEMPSTALTDAQTEPRTQVLTEPQTEVQTQEMTELSDEQASEPETTTSEQETTSTETTTTVTTTETMTETDTTETTEFVGPVLSEEQIVLSSAGESVITSTHASGKAAAYGGLIGNYLTDGMAHELSIGAVKVKATNSTGGSYDYFGGGIGIIDKDHPAYVCFNGFQAEASGSGTLTFGGLAARADYAFVDAKGVTVKATGGYKGGGIVGYTSKGVIRLSGKTKFTEALANAPGDGESQQVGQLVGFRDDALVFAEEGWQFHRYEFADDKPMKVDDIGAWGEVLRFSKTTTTETMGNSPTKTTTEKFSDLDSAATVLTVNELEHTVTINAPVPYTSLATVEDFAKAALCFQLNVAGHDFLSFENTTEKWSTIKTKDIKLTATISLKGTGITGLTRDNAVTNPDKETQEEKHTYSGKFSGNSNSIELELAIGEPYGYRNNTAITSHAKHGDGLIYRHKYNGLFGVSNCVAGTGSYAVSAITFKGNVDVRAQDTMYVGSYAARMMGSGTMTADDVKVLTVFSHGGTAALTLGRLAGDTAATVETINVSNCSFSGNVTGANTSESTCIGGVIGKIGHNSNEAETWTFSTVSLSGTLQNTGEKAAQKIGGLVACIEDYTVANNAAYASRKLILTTVTADNLHIKGAVKDKNNAKLGGLLGYSWYNTDVDFDGVTIGGTTQCSVELTNNAGHGNMAGLVNSGTGNWTVKDLDLEKIKITSSAAVYSFGMILNVGWNNLNATDNSNTAGDSSVIYLLLPTAGCYVIDTAEFGTNFSAPVYDELVAYSAYYRVSDNERYPYVDGDANELYVLRNGAGVVSICTNETKGLVMNGTSASKSYACQTEKGNVANPYTRYYYNLNSVTESGLGSTTPEIQLMTWALNRYAHKSIRSNFASGESINANLTYDLTGYSWYPVDVSETVDVSGNFTFANAEFEGSEQKKYETLTATEYQRTSLDSPEKTQHYLLHAGLFRNVKSTVNVYAISLAGTVSMQSTGSGALICGTVSGESANNRAKVLVKTNGSITLSGIGISGYTCTAPTAQNPNPTNAYAPLLINKAGSNVEMYISDVKVKDDVTESVDDDDDPDTPDVSVSSHVYTADSVVASSLIGDFGNPSADNIKIEFSRIQLDARDSTGVDTGTYGGKTLEEIYHTTRSLFSRATLLNQFSYHSGGSGIYNYTKDQDWDASGNHIGNVTYGLEINDSSPNNTTSGRSQYYGKEFCYKDSENEQHPYVSPTTNEQSGIDDFPDYQPYVWEKYDGETKRQLEVNHTSAVLTGCGTYNDPYYISNAEPERAGEQLLTIEKILNNRSLSDGEQKINLPLNSSGKSDLSTTWDANGHAEYIYRIQNPDNSNNKAGFYLGGSYSADNQTLEKVRTYLVGAYYKLGSAVTLEANTNFAGLGNTTDNYAIFRGVMDGGGFTITNKTNSPLIEKSNGSVVRNLIINPSAAITKKGTTAKFDVSSPNDAYGAVIAKVLGGDNIIDNARLSFTGTTITLTDTAQLVPVGGYVGVVLNGGVVFRGMDSVAAADKQGIPANGTIVRYGSGSGMETNLCKADNMRWLYVNPIIGRVINGYAVTESTAYRPFEDGTRVYHGGARTLDDGTEDAAGLVTEYWAKNNSTGEIGAVDSATYNTTNYTLQPVTMRNGNKHYSIADIKSAWGEGSDGKRSLTYTVTNTQTNTSETKYYLTDEEKLDNSTANDIKIPNAQSFFLISLMVNSGLRSKKVGYNQSYQVSRWAQYDIIGSDASNASGSDYATYAQNDKLKSSNVADNYGYLAKFYTKDIFKISSIDTKLTLNGSGTYYLPDGYKGIGNMFDTTFQVFSWLGDQN